ncbi:MAG: hypothetical protein RL254_555 [Planctomycetota bacterium]
MTRICVIEPIGISTEEIRSALPGHDVDVFDSRGWADSELIARCAGAEVLASTNRPISVSVIDALEGLRLIAIAFAGVDSVAAAAAESHGVTVTNARGYADTAVAELTVGLMISLARQIPAQNVAIRSGGTTSMGTQLRGKTIAVIGTGAIGTEVVRLCGAFGMTVIGFDEGSTKTLPEVVAEADFVSLHVPLLPETRGMVSGEVLSAMKPTAFLINCARGPIVDSAALDVALGSGAIAGAALDVFDQEPPLPADYPLLAHANVIATPHIGFDTVEAVRSKGEMALAHIREYLAGNKPARN